MEWVLLLLKFQFRVEFFDFRVSALQVYPVSGAGLLDFPQLHPMAALMQMLFWRNNIEDGNCHSPGLFVVRVIVSGALIYFLCKSNRKISCL
jgi:hypothetical protein